MSSRQLPCGSRSSQESPEPPEPPAVPDDSDNPDAQLKVRQQKLDHQRELLEKRQRRKRLDPRIVQPNPDSGLPLVKKRSGESRFHLRSSCPPTTDFILPGAVAPVATTRSNNQDSVPELPLNSSAGTSTANDAVGRDLEIPDSSQDSFVTVEDIDEYDEKLRLRKLVSKKFFNIHDVAGLSHEDLVPKTPTPSRESLTTVHEIDEHLEHRPVKPVKLTSKKFFNIHDVAGLSHEDLVPKTPTPSRESLITVHEIDEHVEHRPVKPVKLTSKKFFNIHDVAGLSHEDLVPKTPTPSRESLITVHEIDEHLEHRPVKPVKLTSKKFFNIHDVTRCADNKDLRPTDPSWASLTLTEKIEALEQMANSSRPTARRFSHKDGVTGADNKDLRPTDPSWASLTLAEKIEACEVMPRSLMPTAWRFSHKGALTAQVIMEVDEEDEASDESAEVILKQSLPLSMVQKSEGAANLKSVMGPTKSSKTAETETAETDVPEVNSLLASLFHMKDFAYSQAPEDVAVKCMIIRDMNGVFPGYFMFVEVRPNKEMFVLAAKRYKKFMRSEFIISTDIMDLKHGGPNYIGRLRANLMKTKYTLYTCMYPNMCRDSTEKCSMQQELGTITYKNKALGFQRPKSVSVIIPSSTGSEEPVSVKSKSTFKNFFSKWRKKTKDNVIELKSKNFFGNRRQNSPLPQRTKDKFQIFQLFQENEPSRVVMQLEHVMKHKYVMEYRHPLSTVQAFAIALSRFDRG